MLRMRCNGCDAVIKVGDDKAGNQINCPKCNARITVPFDHPEVRLRREIEQPPRSFKPQSPPTFVEQQKVDLNELISLQRAHDAEMCEKLDGIYDAMLASGRHTRAIRSNTTIIGVLFMIIAIPMILTMGCNILAGASAVNSIGTQELSTLQEHQFD